MSPEPTKNGSPTEEEWEKTLRKYNAIWPAFARTISFSIGAFGFVWQVVLESADRPYLIAGAITAMGLPVAGWVSDTIRKGGS